MRRRVRKESQGPWASEAGDAEGTERAKREELADVQTERSRVGDSQVVGKLEELGCRQGKC